MAELAEGKDKIIEPKREVKGKGKVRRGSRRATKPNIDKQALSLSLSLSS